MIGLLARHPGFESEKGKEYETFGPALEPIQPPMGTAHIYPGGKATEVGGYHAHPSSAEVKND